MGDKVLQGFCLSELNEIKTLAKGVANPLCKNIHQDIANEIIEIADKIIEEINHEL